MTACKSFHVELIDALQVDCKKPEDLLELEAYYLT
jgi:hypothetical protein